MLLSLSVYCNVLCIFYFYPQSVSCQFFLRPVFLLPDCQLCLEVKCAACRNAAGNSSLAYSQLCQCVPVTKCVRSSVPPTAVCQTAVCLTGLWPTDVFRVSHCSVLCCSVCPVLEHVPQQCAPLSIVTGLIKWLHGRFHLPLPHLLQLLAPCSTNRSSTRSK